MYDPLFQAQDLDLVAELGMLLPTDNTVRRGACYADAQCGHYTLTVPTFVYMPHCPRELYEALLRANWSSESLRDTVLCGNDLSHYSMAGEAVDAFPCIRRISPYTHSCELPQFPAMVSGALDASLQCFFADSTLWDDFRAREDSPAPSEGAWSYKDLTRKTRKRRGRSSARSSPTPTPIDPTTELFWHLPPESMDLGPEVLTTPICNDMK